MWDGPDFLDLPARDRKPRLRGLTHVLDKGTTMPELEAVLAGVGHLIDVFKIGWGISYVDRTVKERVALCGAAGITVCLGGTLLEVCAAQGKVDELREWAIDLGVDAVEVSNGLRALRAGQKTGLVRTLAADFQVFAETGAGVRRSSAAEHTSGLARTGSSSRHRRNPSRPGSSAGSGPARTWATCR